MSENLSYIAGRKGSHLISPSAIHESFPQSLQLQDFYSHKGKAHVNKTSSFKHCRKYLATLKYFPFSLRQAAHAQLLLPFCDSCWSLWRQYWLLLQASHFVFSGTICCDGSGWL
eukprot:gb/GECG01011411.1/.p1 GENE.gb/GECG01011411.1/~~gb/GECG01011411.1/.p1  ORF type:complete len:114 (+),score=5.06 gb/GECG01011411.1/:1-342(+)